MKPLLAASLLLACAGVAHSQNIYKCTSADGLVYRDTPCAIEDRQQTLVVASSRNASGEPSHRESGQAESSPRNSSDFRVGLPLGALHLTVGMTDTQVLNLAGWGRPAQIIRSKAVRTFREEWIYNRAGDEKHLYFENGRLASRDDISSLPVAGYAQPGATYLVYR